MISQRAFPRGVSVSFKHPSRNVAQHTSDGPARNLKMPNDDVGDGDESRGAVPPTGTTGISPCRSSLRAPSRPHSPHRAAAAAERFAFGPGFSFLSPVGLPSPLYTDIRCDEHPNRNVNTNETDIGRPLENQKHISTNAAACPITQKTRPANILPCNVLQEQRNTFADILRRLRGSGPWSERVGGDNLSSLSGHSFLRSRSA